MSGEVLYDDGGTMLDADGIVLRRYYFPLATAKRIPYGEVRGVHSYAMTALNGRGRVWGTANPAVWFPLDAGRPRKDTALIIDTGARIKPVITPDRPDEVLALIESRLTPR